MLSGYPTPIAAKLVGLPLKTLDNWRSRKFIVPAIAARSPLPALYSFRDLIALRVASDLSARGIEVHCLTRVVEYLRRRRGLELTASDVLASTMLVTDGHDVYEIDGGAPVSTLRNPDQAVMLVPLGRFIATIQAAASKIPAQTKATRTRSKVA